MRRVLVGAAVAAVVLVVAAVAVAQIINGVPNANPRSGSPPNVVASGFALQRVVNGNDTLENPAGIFTRYGYLDDSTLQSDGQPTKTEPDQNTYLVTHGSPGGPTAGYDYGHHFLIQGHEVFTPSGATYNRAYFTRVNLDVTDPAHRVTLLNPLAADATDSGVRSIDGSTYDPFTGQLLFTAEAGNLGGVFGQALRWSGTTAPPVANYDGSMGKAGYEGIHNDKLGNLILIEDVGGGNVTSSGVKQPNSFVYRFVPTRAGDLTKGKLQVLQISVNGSPVTFHSTTTDGAAAALDDAMGADILAIAPAGQVGHHPRHGRRRHGGVRRERCGQGRGRRRQRQRRQQGHPAQASREREVRAGHGLQVLRGRRDRRHEQAGRRRAGRGRPRRMGSAAAHRPAQGRRRHGDGQGGRRRRPDTRVVRQRRLPRQAHGAADRGSRRDAASAADALDSLWSFDITQPLDKINADAKRLIAQGRDPEATGDIGLKEPAPPKALTHNDGDNEVTGIHVSDGSTSPSGILGSELPSNAGSGRSPWRIFVTGQHGANITCQIVATGKQKHGGW